MATIPEKYIHLLEQPHLGSLGTVRPDGTVQVNPIWFEYDGAQVRFTHTTTRAKYRNLMHNPTMSLSVFDPGNPYHYVELRGGLVAVEPDPGGEFYVHLARRYGSPNPEAPADAADRVVLVMSIGHVCGM